MTDLEIIIKLGGSAAVARLCGIKSPAVSVWKKKGIPKLRRIQLQALRPDVFNDQTVQQPAA